MDVNINLLGRILISFQFHVSRIVDLAVRTPQSTILENRSRVHDCVPTFSYCLRSAKRPGRQPVLLLSLPLTPCALQCLKRDAGLIKACHVLAFARAAS